MSPRSYLWPPGWVGIVVLGDAALATAPDHDTARLIEQALGDLPFASLADGGVLSSRLPAAEILGPAALAYLDPAEFRARPGHALTTPVDLDDPGFRQFVLAADADDVEESGIQEITTAAFAVREPRAAASAAVAHALEEDRLPQWRARPQASRRVAHALGFRELGFQVSIRLAAAVTSREH